MWSTPRRRKEASQALLTYSGLPLIPTQLPSSRRSLPYLVARVTRSRLSAMAFKEGYAELQGPVDGGDRLVLLASPVELAHPHAPQTQLRNYQTFVSERTAVRPLLLPSLNLCPGNGISKPSALVLRLHRASSGQPSSGKFRSRNTGHLCCYRIGGATNERKESEDGEVRSVWQ